MNEAVQRLIDGRKEILAYRQVCQVAMSLLSDNPAQILSELVSMMDFIDAHLQQAISQAKLALDGYGDDLLEDRKGPGSGGGE